MPVASPSAPRASAAERERLVSDFIRLCELESPSRRERAVSDYVAAELAAVGISVDEDSSAEATGSDAGNLLARVAGPEDRPPILLCAHLDTVPLDAPVEPVLEEGVLRNRNQAILGADNKAAVAVLLAIARRLAPGGGAIGVELLFTTCEEMALAGAKALDRAWLRSELGFVFDHASPIGELIVAAPTYYRVEARFSGVAAHAGIRPEEGRNAIAAAARGVAAMRLGRLDAETTANVGRIDGGTATNVVAERCLVELEARSLDPQRASEVAAQLVDAMAEAASDADCDLETVVEEQFRGYRLPRSAPQVAVAGDALAALGIEPRHVATGGGSDANALVAAGIPCLNVANGTEANHEPDESVTVEALETMLDVVIGIVAGAERAETLASESRA